MRIIVKPAKRAGNSKTIFESKLSSEDLDGLDRTGIIISITADPIYTNNRYQATSQYRYDIMLSAEEISTIASAVERRVTE
ncbi:hypothetical protein ABFT80_26040 [Mesorhizobium sp. SB112]|uniref:hypothetical protein n=1 Tax=Mesorhizobium sp. SB112 TaxID=3151853 RepID=UPI003266F94F